MLVPEARPVRVAALTSRQRRIAMLAAEGVPVRDIAESLFLTPRGVEQHLTEVRLRLLKGDNARTFEIPLPVDITADLYGELKSLLGPSCLL